MIIIGFDPGYARIGWAILEKDKSKVTVIGYGCIETKKTLSDEVRLSDAYNKIEKLIKTYKPEVSAIELLYFTTNQKTAFAVSQGRGMLLTVCGNNNLPVFSYTPLQIKTAITGYGKADKHQMQSMIQSLLNLKKIPEPDDAADALAVALTHCYTKVFK